MNFVHRGNYFEKKINEQEKKKEENVSPIRPHKWVFVQLKAKTWRAEMWMYLDLSCFNNLISVVDSVHNAIPIRLQNTKLNMWFFFLFFF